MKALESRGWDKEGKVMAKLKSPAGDDLGAGREKEKEKGDLKGTLEVHTLTMILQATGEEVQREAEILVEIIWRKCSSQARDSNQKAAGSIA